MADVLPLGMLAAIADRNQPAPEPEKIRAPIPKPPKVIGDPTRTPVNLQAARLTMKASWLYQPLPAQEPPRGGLDKLREECAALRLAVKNLTMENKAMRRKLEQKPKAVAPAPVPPAPVAETTNTEAKRKIMERLKNVR